MIFSALFTKSDGEPATGLTLTDIEIYLYARAKTTGTVTTIWDGEHPTAEIGTVGHYAKEYADADSHTYDYFAKAVYTGSETLDSNFSVQQDPMTDHPTAIWGYATRTLTQTAAEVQAALEGSRITIHRGDDLSVSLTGLGSLAGRTHLWLTAKASESYPDTKATIQITETGGLLYLNSAEAGTPGNGSITVDDEDAGDITIVLAAVETAKLESGTTLTYDVQVLIGAMITTLTESSVRVTSDVTRATSA
ncbi:MAG TPA: hypothetical protein VMX14_03735 [Anaerolineae bacterium]|nr:hypothetical protein [Anaerolineae bacterium]HUW13383.1 hypothetical protein [Anaerolineae bacterium]